MFRNVKWFTLAVSILLIVQYISVLLNVSYETKTSVFPDPFQDPLKPRPIPIPIYRHFGEPITNTTIVPDQGTELPVPQPWGFFLGLIVSRRRFNNLWVDYLAILVMHYFFIYFYSVSYELDMGLNTKEAVSRTISNINNEVGDSVIQSFAEKEENKSQDYRSSYDEIIEKSKKTNYFEAQKYIDKVKSKMILSKFYEGVSTTVCATSSIVSLVCLLMIAFQIEGFINLFYIVFCLWHLTKAVNFVFQKNWTFPLYLKLLLKYIVIIELLIQLGLQVPVPYLHPENFKVKDDNPKDPEEILLDPKWMRVIGFISFWRVNPDTKVPENTDINGEGIKRLKIYHLIG